MVSFLVVVAVVGFDGCGDGGRLFVCLLGLPVGPFPLLYLEVHG